jgi:hypothetical protein
VGEDPGRRRGAGRIVFDRLLTFRGDTDEAWQKAESFVARDVLNAVPTFGKQGDAVAPVKLAVFDFELEDFSGGAGVIPESDQGREQLRLATETVRRLLVESGRYSLVDVSGADAATCAPTLYANATVAMPQSLVNSTRINLLSGL